VVREEHAGRPECGIRLVVEVTESWTRAVDRTLRPHVWAQAGVPHYWRLDLEGRCLVSHELADGEVYRETGRYTDDVVLDEPVALRFRLADLLP
jgi:hypothetical protein